MLKGCKKNVVYVKNTGSEMFEEAYFIVSDRAEARGGNESDMVREAGKIISCSPVASYFSQGEGTKNKIRLNSGALFFTLGAAVMAALNAVLYLII